MAPKRVVFHFRKGAWARLGPKARGKGLLFVLSAPSGVGKSTLAKKILTRDPRFWHSVSCTTRAPRSGDKNGRDYRFASRQEFSRAAGKGSFLETAEVHGALYGTPRDAVEAALGKGRHVLLTIDVRGGANIAKAYPGQTVRVFLLPPDTRTWIARLRRRREPDWARRVANARKELGHLSQYDYAIVNDNLGAAVKDFFSIARAEELRRVPLGMRPNGGVRPMTGGKRR